MRRLAAFVCVMMAAVLLWTAGPVRAMEIVDCAEVSSEAPGHYDGDSDQVPSDPDKGAPHHHGGCHGHCAAVPVGDGRADLTDLGSNAQGLRRTSFPTGCDPGTSLRPPIA